MRQVPTLQGCLLRLMQKDTMHEVRIRATSKLRAQGRFIPDRLIETGSAEKGVEKWNQQSLQSL